VEGVLALDRLEGQKRLQILRVLLADQIGLERAQAQAFVKRGALETCTKHLLNL